MRASGSLNPHGSSASGSPTPSGPAWCGRQVEDRQPHADPDALGADPLDDRPHGGRPLGQLAVARQQLVEEVAVARLHVDEVEAGVAREPGGGDVVADEVVELGGGEDGAGAARVEQRVARAPGLGSTDHRPLWVSWRPVTCSGSRRPWSSARSSAEDGPRQSWWGLARPVGPHRERLAAPDQAGAARAEAPPAAAHEVGRPAVVGAVPSLHREDAEAVGAGPPGHLDRRRQRVDVGRVGEREGDRRACRGGRGTRRRP